MTTSNKKIAYVDTEHGTDSDPFIGDPVSTRIALTFQLEELDELFNALKVTEVNQRALQPGLLDQLLQDVGKAADRLRQAPGTLDSQRAKGDVLRAAGAKDFPAVARQDPKDSQGLPSVLGRPVWLDALTSRSWLSFCKTFLACTPEERGNLALEEIARSLVEQAEKEVP